MQSELAVMEEAAGEGLVSDAAPAKEALVELTAITRHALAAHTRQPARRAASSFPVPDKGSCSGPRWFYDLSDTHLPFVWMLSLCQTSSKAYTPLNLHLCCLEDARD